MIESENDWFGLSNAKADLLSPIRKLNVERDKYLASLPISDEDDSASIISFAGSSTTLYSSTKSDVETLITKTIDEEEDAEASLQSKASSKLYLTSKVFREWKEDRKATATRKASSRLQQSMCAIGKFLQGFSGIAEIIKAADQQFGGLAYGTLSLLVSVAMHKQKREELIEEALEELAYAFPRLETLGSVRKTDSLQNLVVEVFELAVLFCRETVDYFAKRLRRLTKAISPLELRTLSRLRWKLLEIQRECAFVALQELADTRKQLHDVQKQLRKMEITGDDTNNRMRESQLWMRKSNAHATESYMIELKKMLDLKRVEDNTSMQSLSRYRSILANEFSDHRRKHKSARPLSAASLKSRNVFSRWKDRQESTILLLGGNNWLDDSSIQLNWLSYASVYVVETTPQACILFFLCQTDYTVPKRKRCLFAEVVRSLVYQLAEQHPDHLRSYHEEISDDISSDQWQSSNSHEAFEIMGQLLIKLLRTFYEDTEFTIVLDRLDQCRWSDDPADETSELLAAVRTLLDIVGDKALSHLRIKILLVMDGGPAKEVASMMEWAKDRGLDWKVDWNQEATDAEED